MIARPIAVRMPTMAMAGNVPAIQRRSIAPVRRHHSAKVGSTLAGSSMVMPAR
jgi:hypothetical protein